jgi:hypothetical protein
MAHRGGSSNAGGVLMHAHDGRIDHLDGRGPTEMEGQVIDLKRRIPILKRLIADCDRLAADLEQEVRNEERRVKIHDPTDLAYSTYAQAATNRRYNLRRSAEEFRAHLARAEKALLELGETPLGVRPD